MKTFSLQLKNSNDIDLVWEQAEKLGCTPLFSTEEEGEALLVIQTTRSKKWILENFLLIKECLPFELLGMDYVKEWEAHAKNFIEGKVHLNLKHGKTVFLAPGAGFGDLSHPTTHLVLDLMQAYVQKQTVIDIGSGSGVLAIASIVLGAKKAVGIDIDPQAVMHAKENSRLNGVETKIQFVTPDEFVNVSIPGTVCALMNMISSEQKVAWQTFIRGRKVSGVLITSGILEEQLDEYKYFAKAHGWTILKVEKKEGWLGFVMEF